MQIATSRAFWILDFYRRHAIRLDFAGVIFGEEATSVIEVTDVWNEARVISVRLFSEDGNQVWDRAISLRRATFELFQLGDPSFGPYVGTPWHTILRADFPDGTVLQFAEGSSPGSPVSRTT